MDPMSYSHTLPLPPRLSAPGEEIVVLPEPRRLSFGRRHHSIPQSWYPPSRPPVYDQLPSSSEQAQVHVTRAKKGVRNIAGAIDGQIRSIAYFKNHARK